SNSTIEPVLLFVLRSVSKTARLPDVKALCGTRAPGSILVAVELTAEPSEAPPKSVRIGEKYRAPSFKSKGVPITAIADMVKTNRANEYENGRRRIVRSLLLRTRTNFIEWNSFAVGITGGTASLLVKCRASINGKR